MITIKGNEYHETQITDITLSGSTFYVEIEDVDDTIEVMLHDEGYDAVYALYQEQFA